MQACQKEVVKQNLPEDAIQIDGYPTRGGVGRGGCYCSICFTRPPSVVGEGSQRYSVDVVRQDDENGGKCVIAS